ncbi:MAG: hypothetical protein HS128_22030 [Ideonella sp.]|nr:hypothetical protein [Ideonella sp.]MCC7455682.1 hypothetical protein [Nitrospira sp.]
MPHQPPLGIVVSQIVAGTPHWVWAVLVAITAIGLRHLQRRHLPRAQLLIMPIAFAVFSLWSATQALGAAALWAWPVGVALAFGLIALLPSPAIALDADARLIVPGSPWPLLLIWTIFGLRYALAVTQVMNPALTHQAGFAPTVALLYGLLSGLFAARAWRVLRSAPPTGAAQAVAA